MESDMNIDKLAGEGTDLKGRLKESLGNATGDRELQSDGVADQLSGQVRQGFTERLRARSTPRRSRYCWRDRVRTPPGFARDLSWRNALLGFGAEPPVLCSAPVDGLGCFAFLRIRNIGGLSLVTCSVCHEPNQLPKGMNMLRGILGLVVTVVVIVLVLRFMGVM